MAFKNIRPWPLVLLAACCHYRRGPGAGASVCSINTDWDAQGTWTEPGASIDLRYKFINQDQLMAGSSRVAASEVHCHHDEIRTINRNWIATLNYALSERLGVSISLPVVDRGHEHIHHHEDEEILQNWSFTDLGDARVLGRYHVWVPHRRRVLAAAALVLCGILRALFPSGDQ